MGNHRKAKAWARLRRPAAMKPEDVRANLASRTFDSLETCERVWASSADPAALVEALRHVRIPAWLADALLVALIDADVGGGRFLANTWKRANSARRDAKRALAVAAARSLRPMPTWNNSFQAARHVVDRNVTPHAIKRSYGTTVEAIQRGSLDFFMFSEDPVERVAAAVGRMDQLLFSDSRVFTKTNKGHSKRRPK